jgi:hypothetical protein
MILVQNRTNYELRSPSLLSTAIIAFYCLFVVYSAYDYKLQRSYHLPTPGRNCITRLLALGGVPDAGERSPYPAIEC